VFNKVFFFKKKHQHKDTTLFLTIQLFIQLFFFYIYVKHQHKDTTYFLNKQQKLYLFLFFFKKKHQHKDTKKISISQQKMLFRMILNKKIIVKKVAGKKNNTYLYKKYWEDMSTYLTHFWMSKS
tara:strand:- start:11 stop:382 length:372 start_codon:yes stop_codon:yes gene_type:complete